MNKKEQIKDLEEDYKDALTALETATEEFDEAYKWKRKMEDNANKLAKALQAVKDKEF